MKTVANSIALLILAYLAAANWGGALPDILPQPVESPFPAEGLWLLVASESGDLSGAKSVANAESIRTHPGIESRWLDYGKKGLQEPWAAALAWADGKAGGEPYFVVRGKRGGKEGALSGGMEEMLATVTEALETVD